MIVHVLVPVLFVASLGLWAACGYWWSRNGSPDGLADGFGALASLTAGSAFALERFWPMAALDGLIALVFAWDWWRNRRRRDRAPHAYGAKARALLAALVRKVRETSQPRPVLAPKGAAA